MEKFLKDFMSAMNHLPAEFEWSDLNAVATRFGGEVHNGASRWGVVFKAKDFVIKIPRMDCNEVDYCALELHNYELAKQYRVEKILLPITYIGETDGGVKVYIQPKFSFELAEEPRAHREKLNRCVNVDNTVARKIRQHCFSGTNDLWFRRAVQIYGKAFMESFAEWTKKAQVNDLHNGNIGYLRKQPIILDYADYRGSGHFSW